MLSLIMGAALVAAQPVPAAGCQAALGTFYEGPDEADLPNQVDGTTLAGRDALLALRRARGDALIVIRGGDFSGADFRAARVHNICFIETDLSGSNWRGVHAPGLGFVRADLSGAKLERAQWPEVLLRAANLANVEATGAEWTGGRFDGGWQGSVQDLRLDEADLSDFVFDCGITIGDSCANDGPVSLRGANLTDAAIDTWRAEADFTGARIDDTRVALWQLGDLRPADVVGPILLPAGEASVAISRADLLALLPHIVPDELDFGAPSFDCARAARPVERLLCSEEGASLRPLDRELAALYVRALAADPTVEAAQRAWLAERDRCPIDDQGFDSGCVREAYERRRGELVGAAGRPEWARPGVYAYFVEAPIRFDPAFRSDPLYLRLVPALVGSTWSSVVVRVNADGTIDARGEAIGGNAHSCSLGGDGLALDPATGWYSGPQPVADDDPPAYRGRPMPVLLLDGDEVEVWQNGHFSVGSEWGDPRVSNYASCGARAGFGRMVRMPLPEAEVRAIFEQLEEPIEG
jgi:uncharacterized protein YjbI with pentapeptide repeats